MRYEGGSMDKPLTEAKLVPMIAEMLRVTGGSMNEDKPGPGKFEGNRSLSESETLHEMSLEGGLDAEAGGAESGYWVGLVIRGSDDLASPAYVLTADSHGFFNVRPFETRVEAEAVYAMFVAELPLRSIEPI